MCKGLVFRCTQNTYFNQEKLQMVETRKMTLLKRKSCKGCAECGGLLDFAKEVLADYDSIPIKYVDTFKEYTVNVTDDEIEFVPIKETLPINARFDVFIADYKAHKEK